MTAKLLSFPISEGNGSRDALIEALQQPLRGSSLYEPTVADIILAEMYIRGFAFMPVEDEK